MSLFFSSNISCLKVYFVSHESRRSILWLLTWIFFSNSVCLHLNCVLYIPHIIGVGDGTHSSALAWKIPWTEEPGGLQSIGSLRVGHDWATSLSLFTFMHWRRKRQPTPVFLPGESQGWGAWRVAVCGVAESRTRLKRLSSSSRSILESFIFLSVRQSLSLIGVYINFPRLP